MAEMTRFQRLIGGLLGENMEGMTEEQRRRLAREGGTAAILGMLSGSGLLGGLEGLRTRRKEQATQAEAARRVSAAEAEMPRITGRLFGGTAGELESLPGGEGGPLTARYRQAPQEALARLYGTQAGRDVAAMAPDLTKVATEGALGRTVGGAVYNPLTGGFTRPPEAAKPRVPSRTVDLGNQVVVYYDDGTTEVLPKGMAPRAGGAAAPPRAAAAGGGAPGVALAGDGEALPPTWGREDATTLRKEATGLLNEYQKFGDAWGRVKEAALSPSAANDIALIFAYMKILDPTSAVREGEFATAADAGGIPQRVWAKYNNIIRGERLNPEQRSDFLSSAYSLVRSQHANAQRVVERYKDLARGYNLPPEAVAQNPLSWAIAPKVKSDEDFNKLQPGTLFEDPNGRLRVKPR